MSENLGDRREGAIISLTTAIILISFLSYPMKNSHALVSAMESKY